MRTERSEPILPSRDLDETRAFYRRIGFAPWFGDGPYEIVARGNLVLHFEASPGHSAIENRGSCYLRVRDADALYRELVALPELAGSALLSSPCDEPWGMREFTLRDPSGNLLRFGHDLDAEHAYVPSPPASAAPTR